MDESNSGEKKKENKPHMKKKSQRERNIASQVQVLLTTLDIEIRKIKRMANQKNDYMRHYLDEYIKLYLFISNKLSLWG